MVAIILLSLTVVVGALGGLAILRIAHAILIRDMGIAPSLEGRPMHDSVRKGTP